MHFILILSCLLACRAEFADEMQEYEKECIGEDRFTCLDGSCIAHEQYCDGKPDCADGDDENFCADHPPDAHLCNVTHQFLCRDGLACVPATWVCNGAPDCTDASDEANCTSALNTTSKCGKAFTCDDGACISSLWACDGHYDCEDRSDENVDTCKHALKAHLETDGLSCYDFPGVGPRHYKCLDSSFCLVAHQMCDGIVDCRDNSDEGPFCEKWRTICDNSTCPATITQCTPERSGPHCICSLSPNARWYNETSARCEDIDECLAERPSCSHRCKNYDGHFRCHCDVGYVADSFQYLCFAEGPEAMLFFSTEKDIRYIKVKTKQEVQVATGIKKSHGVSYDGKYLYWVETAEGHQAIARAHLENPTETKETLVSLGLYDPGDVAVDWLGGNIYFSDAARHAIYVCKTDGSMCTRLKVAAYRPRFVTLDVRNGVMYWADISPDIKHVIMRARMDGSHHEVLLDDLKNFATGLALDAPNDRLYFVDRTIRVVKVDTKQAYSLFEERFHHPYAISVFENTVYWSDWTSNTIQTIDKLHSAVKRNVLATLHAPVYGMHIYHPVLINRDSNPCAVHNCSHLCLLTSNTTYSCACPTGMQLNGTTCYTAPNYRPRYLIVGAGASFTRIQHDALGNPEAHATTFDIGRVQAMAHDSRKDVLYVYDGMRKCINTIELADFTLGVTRVFAFNGLDNVVDMDYDYVTDTLYVLDAGRRFLEVFSLKDGKRALLHRFPDQEIPVSFCVLQNFGRLLVAVLESEQNNEIHIDSIGLDGDVREHQHVIMNNIKGPRVRLRHVPHTNLVAISDESSRSIDYIHLSLSASGVRQDIKTLLPTTISSVATLLPFVFWTDGRTPRVFWGAFGDESSIPRRMELTMFPNDTHLHIQATSEPPKPMDPLSSHPCTKSPCSHICVQRPRGKILGHLESSLATDYTYKCLCPPGTIVEGGNCSKLVACGTDESYCYKSNKCIPWIKRCDGEKDCPDGEDEEDCSASTPRPSSKCLPTQVECNGGCIHSGDVCPKEIIETNPSPFYCEFEQFQCRESRLCLEREQVCDQQQDCPDGSDEGSFCHDMRCLETEFMCTSGNCILSSWRCDGDADCNDGSDEVDCANRTCNIGSYQCRSGQCVDLHQRCDGQPDCVDGSDEERCREPTDSVVTIPTCVDGEFSCELNKSICLPQTARCNKIVDCPGGTDELGCGSFCAVHGLFECKQEQICVSMRRICNHNKDCTDGSDETPEACALVNRTSRVFPQYPAAECHHGFLCGTGQCLEWREVCDNTPNCFDGSDENGVCFTACENNTCSHHCQPTPLGAQCTCRAGYSLSDQHACVDTDECLRDACAQRCTNTPGSFLCECRHGYTLRSDRRSCKANIGALKTILYVSGYSVRSISELGLGRVEFEDPTLGSIGDVDINVARHKIYVTSPQSGKLIEVTTPDPWRTIDSTGQNVFTNIGKPTKLAVEWVTSNVYFVDNSTEPSIKVCNFNKKKCATLKKLPAGVRITSLVVSPETRHLYYCAANHQGSFGPVASGDLAGQNIMNTESGECTGLSVDGTVLYVAGPMQLQSLDPDRFYGNKDIPDWPHLSPQSIIVFEDYVYILNTDKVYRCLLFGAKTCQPYIYSLPAAQAFVILHPSIQRRDLRNECEGYVCDNVCVLGQHGAQCLCEDGTVSADGSCSLLLEKSQVPLFNGVPSQHYASEHSLTYALVSVTLVLFLMYLTIFGYYYCVYRPRKEAVTLPVRFHNQTLEGSSTDAPTIEMPTTSGAGHEFVNPLQFVRNFWQRSFGKSGRPIGTAGLTIEIPTPPTPSRPNEDLSDTESDRDFQDDATLIRKPPSQ